MEAFARLMDLFGRAFESYCVAFIRSRKSCLAVAESPSRMRSIASRSSALAKSGSCSIRFITVSSKSLVRAISTIRQFAKRVVATSIGTVRINRTQDCKLLFVLTQDIFFATNELSSLSWMQILPVRGSPSQMNSPKPLAGSHSSLPSHENL